MNVDALELPAANVKGSDGPQAAFASGGPVKVQITCPDSSLTSADGSHTPKRMLQARPDVFRKTEMIVTISLAR